MQTLVLAIISELLPWNVAHLTVRVGFCLTLIARYWGRLALVTFCLQWQGNMILILCHLGCLMVVNNTFFFFVVMSWLDSDMFFYVCSFSSSFQRCLSCNAIIWTNSTGSLTAVCFELNVILCRYKVTHIESQIQMKFKWFTYYQCISTCGELRQKDVWHVWVCAFGQTFPG